MYYTDGTNATHISPISPIGPIRVSWRRWFIAPGRGTRNEAALPDQPFQLGLLQQHDRFSILDFPGFYHL
jgi:hypothetical protein